MKNAELGCEAQTCGREGVRKGNVQMHYDITGLLRNQLGGGQADVPAHCCAPQSCNQHSLVPPEENQGFTATQGKTRKGM